MKTSRDLAYRPPFAGICVDILWVAFGEVPPQIFNVACVALDEIEGAYVRQLSETREELKYHGRR